MIPTVRTVIAFLVMPMLAAAQAADLSGNWQLQLQLQLKQLTRIATDLERTRIDTETAAIEKAVKQFD